MSRLLYAIPINANRNYLADQNRDAFRTPVLCKSTLVTSLCDDGLHRPSIDVDVPAAFTDGPSGRILWVDVDTSATLHAQMLDVAHQIGFPDRPDLKSLGKGERRRLYAQESFFAVDFTTVWGTCIALADQFLGSFEELVTAGLELTEGLSLRRGPSMKNPWPLPLPDCEVLLPQSSTSGHSHLYMDLPLDWSDYAQLLELMVACSIVEPGYLGASTARGATNLRRPGYFKGVGA